MNSTKYKEVSFNSVKGRWVKVDVLSTGSKYKYGAISEVQFDVGSIVTSTASVENPTTPAPSCQPNWSCSDWSLCVNNTQNRTCLDLSSCNLGYLNYTESMGCGVAAVSDSEGGGSESSGGGSEILGLSEAGYVDYSSLLNKYSWNCSEKYLLGYVGGDAGGFDIPLYNYLDKEGFVIYGKP
ncbi:MAG: hypothetical protein KKB21_01490, partial [Nanoarchaeota archaeon]|nr:hypothetical protein [Nanoarchaeota archaeon]